MQPFTRTLKIEYPFIKHVAFAVREKRTSHVSGCAMIRKTGRNSFPVGRFAGSGTLPAVNIGRLPVRPRPAKVIMILLPSHRHRNGGSSERSSEGFDSRVPVRHRQFDDFPHRGRRGQIRCKKIKTDCEIERRERVGTYIPKAGCLSLRTESVPMFSPAFYLLTLNLS